MEYVFLLSLLISLIIVLLPKKWTVNTCDTIGIQKFHKMPTPRIGGVPIFIAFRAGVWLIPDTRDLFTLFFIASTPIFVGGLIEDITAKASPKQRMLMTIISIVIAFYWMDIDIRELGFSLSDYLLNYNILALLFTLLVVGGAVNSINIIDGYNGLMPGYSIFVLLAIAYVANKFGDIQIVQLSLLFATSLSAIFIFNFPFGKIFIGDAGAYFTGFTTAIIGLMLGSRNNEISHWFLLLLFIYPLFETVFSMYRKKIKRNMSPILPDGLHLHMLIYKRLIKNRRFKNNQTLGNSMTSIFLWLLSSISIIPALIWHENQTILIVFVFIFMVIYVVIYRRLVRFKFL